MRIWKCPTCGTGLRAPNKLGPEDTRGVCLPCSASSPTLVRRVCPAEVRKRAARVAGAATKRETAKRQRSERETRETAREALATYVDGVDLEAVSLTIDMCVRAAAETLRGTTSYRDIGNRAIPPTGTLPWRLTLKIEAEACEGGWRPSHENAPRPMQVGPMRWRTPLSLSIFRDAVARLGWLEPLAARPAWLGDVDEIEPDDLVSGARLFVAANNFTSARNALVRALSARWARGWRPGEDEMIPLYIREGRRDRLALELRGAAGEAEAVHELREWERENPALASQIEAESGAPAV